MNLTENEVIKALECCIKDDCHKCPDTYVKCKQNVMQNALELINHKDEKIKSLEHILMGVMHSVDKWLDGDELKQDEVNRAATMREKTLQITEKQKEEIERLHTEGLQINKTFMDFVNKQKVEAIKEFADIKRGYWIAIEKIFTTPAGINIVGVIGYKCSLCGRTEINKEPYCNCGAEMS